jgi:hypothetical protein
MPTDLTLPSHARYIERAAEKRMTTATWLVLTLVLPILVALIACDVVAGHSEPAAQTVLCFEAGRCL